MTRTTIRKVFFSCIVFTLVALVCWPITTRSAPQIEENTAIVAARAELDRALADAQADPTKDAALAVDRARETYYAAVAEHGDEILANFRKLVASLGSEFLEDPRVLHHPELGGPVRDYQTLGTLNAAADAEALFEPYASGAETEPNDGAAVANPMATLDPCSGMAGRVNPGADLDYFSLSIAAGERVWAVVDTGSPPAQLGASMDSLLDLIDTDGATVIETDDDDGTSNGGDGTIETTLGSVIAGRTLAVPGTYFLRVREFGGNDVLDPYRLYAVLSNASHMTGEVEPNGTAATANRIIPAGRKVGVRKAAIAPLGEVDYFAFPANFGDRLLIAADGDPEKDALSTNVGFELIAPDGVTVLITANSSSNSGGFTGEGLAWNVTAPGTYFVRVTGGGETGTYDLMVSNCTSSFCVVNADCSDGNSCTDDVCNADGSCSNPNNVLPCNDGVFCNGVDTCAGGTCSVHPGDPCPGGPQCNNMCDEIGDTCFSPPGTACGDASDTYCTDPDTCDGAGGCRTNSRPDGSPCISTCANNACNGGVCTGPTGSTCIAPILYGSAYSGADGLASLYRIDPASGGFALIGGIGFQRVSAIDFGPDGRLYGVGERNDGSDTSVLIVIDTATGAGREVGPTGVAALGFGDTVADISFRKSDGRLYAYLEPFDGLGVIDPATGAASAIGATGLGDAGNGIAFSRSNLLYQAGAFTLHTLNQATGAPANVSGLNFVGFPGGFPRVNGMDAEPASGILFGSVNAGSGGAGPSYLATVDTTGVVTHIGPTVAGLDAIAWQPNRCPTTLYGASHSGPAGASTLHRVDPNTGIAGAIGPIGFNGVGGMDFHPVTKVLYAVGKRPVVQLDVLITIDPLTGIGTEVGPLVNAGLGAGGGGLFDVSFRSDGTLFLTAFDPAQVFKLFTVNLATGLATAVGNTGVAGGGNALGFTLTDSLFQATTLSPNHTLYLMNQMTGAGSFSKAISYAGFPAPTALYRPDAMDVDPSSGVPFVVVNDGSGGSGPTYLGTLNVRTGRIDRIGLTAAGLDALAWRSDCDDADSCTLDECVRCEDAELYGARYSGPDGLATLYRIDPATGAAVAIGPIGFQRVSAMEYDEVAGVLYATGERNDGSNTNVLLTIDPSTGAGTEVGPTNVLALGFGASESDLSFRNSDGKLYAYIEGGDGVGTINAATGAATAVGFTGISDLGNGMEFSRGDVLYHAATNRLATIDQSTGAKTVVAALSFVGFPPLGFPRVNAMDVNCDGRMYAFVNDGGGGGGGPTYLAVVNLATGDVTHIGPTVGGLDAIAWRTTHGFCRTTFVDTDLDTVCDALDCAPGDPSAYAVPGEVAITSVDKTGATTDAFTHTNAGGGSGTVHDAVADLLTALPVGPGGGGELFACGYPGTTIGFGAAVPPAGAGWWLVIRGHNACGPGSYGNTHTNPGPPLNGPPRTTTTCP